MRIVSTFLALSILVGCTKGGDAPTPVASASAVPSARPTAAPSASAAAVVAAPSATPSAAPAKGVTAGDACERVLKSGIGKICEAKPATAPMVSASQLTLPKPVGFTREIYAGFFTFASAADWSTMLAAFKAEKVGAKRKPPIFMTNAKSMLIVGVDGEIAAADADRIRKVVDAL
ncbi:MAG: hypothetical protein U0235_03190 [Polyangiaceae bacterium]